MNTCDHCRCPMAPHTALFTSNGDAVCEACHEASLLDDQNARVADDHRRGQKVAFVLALLGTVIAVARLVNAIG